MDELISRQAAIDAVRSYYDESDEDEREIEERIADLPSAQPKPRWIPVEEDMPEFGERVLVTKPLIDGRPWVRIAWYGIPMCETNVCFYESDSEWGDCEISGVTAWMPLPEPYRKETEDAEIH